MKTLKYLILPAFLLHLSLNAQESVTLEEVQELAKNNYPLIKRNALLEKTRDYTVENVSKGWLPQISVVGQATYQNEVTQLPFSLPNSLVEPLSKDQYKVYADIQQTVYDGGMISDQKKLAKIQSETEIQKNQVELDKLEERINQIYFGILQSQEQLQQTEITKNDIENGLKKASAQLEYGTIFRSQVDVLKAQLIGLEQRQIEIQSLRKNLIETLSLFTKKDFSENTVFETPAKLLFTGENNRSELKLFTLQQQMLETQKSLVESKNLPKLGAFFQGGYGKPGFNMLINEFDIFYIGGLRLQFPISGLYTKKNDLALLNTQQQDLEIQKENFLFNQNFSTIRNNEELDKLQKLIQKDEELIALRQSIKNASLAQLENGVLNTSDYLREVNAEEQARIQKMTHEIQFLLTQYNQKAQLNN
ncbi:TolC family protein [Kaistella sp. BT6-1-3]|uniref:TolC family protein n=1 Tax=Kaistella yananensis TaxID=2989820 RepID=A0ABT3JMG2_9FLAO|nr:TolC family protein [Kaistella yananensis]MCW4451966.1 TolC family protein [Kaistella yananensis]